MECDKHSSREAVGTCSECGKAICRECKTEWDGNNYCDECVGDLITDIELVAGVIPQLDVSRKAKILVGVAFGIFIGLSFTMGYTVGEISVWSEATSVVVDCFNDNLAGVQQNPDAFQACLNREGEFSITNS